MTMAAPAMAEQRVAMLAPDCDPGLRVMQEVQVSDLRLAAFIGVHAHELGRRQSLVVHVRLGIETVADDVLAQTIDYNRVVEAAQGLADERIALIETFGQRLATACLEHLAVQRVEVLVEKPGALNHAMAAARTVIERR